MKDEDKRKAIEDLQKASMLINMTIEALDKHWDLPCEKEPEN